jgi:hypothetical protein
MQIGSAMEGEGNVQFLTVLKNNTSINSFVKKRLSKHETSVFVYCVHFLRVAIPDSA